MPPHGTWQQTGGSDVSGVLQLVLIVGVAAALAVIVMEFAWLIISLGVVAVAVRLWLLHRRNLAIAAMTDAFAREHEIQRKRDDAALADRRAHEIAVARASVQPAPVVNVTVDPAALLAAAMHAQQPYTAQAQPARVIRGEVEK